MNEINYKLSVNNGHDNICIISKDTTELSKLESLTTSILTNLDGITFTTSLFSDFLEASKQNIFNIYIINTNINELTQYKKQFDLISMNSSAYFLLISDDNSLAELVADYEELYFIHKNNCEIELKAHLKKIIRKQFKNQLILNININLVKDLNCVPSSLRSKLFISIPINAIEYISKEKNYLRIHYYYHDNIKEFYYRSTIRECFNILKIFPEFILVNRSYIINGNNLKALNTGELTMETKSGDIIQLSSKDIKNSIIESLRNKFI